jgi:hypothetical protein
VSGVITGGWEYVWAAYGVTAAVLALFALSLWVRWRAASRGEGTAVPEEEW